MPKIIYIILQIEESQVLILVVYLKSRSCIQFYKYFGKQYIVFQSLSNFEEVVSYLLLHGENFFLVEYYDLPCQILFLDQ